MTDIDRERWNQRYRAGAYDFEPSAWLVAREALLRPRRQAARALDLACGAGRNALYLAGLGYEVEAWDISDVALELLRAELERRRAAGQLLVVKPCQVDLETAVLPVSGFDLVLDIHFLERSLFPSMVAALRSEGVLVVQTLLRRGDTDDRNPAYLLKTGELRAAFGRLEILDYQEDPAGGWAGLVARRPSETSATASRLDARRRRRPLVRAGEVLAEIVPDVTPAQLVAARGTSANRTGPPGWSQGRRCPPHRISGSPARCGR
jgi:SAM-dependent methyltransferase